MQDKAARAAVVELRGAVTDLQAAAHARRQRDALTPAVPRVEPEERGYVSRLRRSDPAALALAVCRDGTDSLAARMKAVPDRYVHGRWVECACGWGNLRRRLFECAGACARWFVSDDEGVWAVRLPDQEPEDVAA